MVDENVEQMKLRLLEEAQDRVETRAVAFEADLERKLERFEERLEVKFQDYLLKLVFENHQQRLDDRIKPLEKLLYGFVALVLTMVIAGVVGLVVFLPA